MKRRPSRSSNSATSILSWPRTTRICVDTWRYPKDAPCATARRCTRSMPRRRLADSLSMEKINRVKCGSQHQKDWSPEIHADEEKPVSVAIEEDLAAGLRI